MSTPEPILMTNQGWATVAFLKLVQEGLVVKAKQGECRLILAPLFEKAERQAFDRALSHFSPQPKEPAHEDPSTRG